MPETAIKTRKKLIEVALPLDKINEESLRRKQKAPKGWPMSFHKWWAQRPLAAARAVIFAQMVDDPSEYTDTLLQVDETRKAAQRELNKQKKLWDDLPDDAERGLEPTLPDCAAHLERERLFRLIGDLVRWDNTDNSYIVEKANAELWQSWRRACADNAGHPRAAELFDRKNLPSFYDPFAGSGAIPLSAQWLGLTTLASDLNPVAVTINKATLEVPSKFIDHGPINPDADQHQKWKGAAGLADDVRYYGKLMREEAEKSIGHLYPKVKITEELASGRPDLASYVGRELTVIAWLWARTVKSPNPAFRDIDVPLASTFVLSTKSGKEAWVEPVADATRGYRFVVRTEGKPPAEAKTGTKLGRGANFRCIMSDGPIAGQYVKEEGRAGRMGARLMAIVAEGDRGRVYLSATSDQENQAFQVEPDWRPDTALPDDPRNFWTVQYGLSTFGDLFTDRQLVVLGTVAKLVGVVRERALTDARNHYDDPLIAKAYADGVAIYLAAVVDRMIYYGSSLSTWLPKDNALRDAMPRQAIAMTWDYAEGNILGKSSVGITTCLSSISSYLDIATPNFGTACWQQDAQSRSDRTNSVIISTDPPYYDNISYADLSDYFYVWLRLMLRDTLPELFGTVSTPKREELIVSPYRAHDGAQSPEDFFLFGMKKTIARILDEAHPCFPTTIYYAFKQAEDDDDEGVASTGWETFLAAVSGAGMNIVGTMPLRTEGAGRMIAKGTNALASSIVLVCRPRPTSAPTATRREFLNALKAELPAALQNLQRGNIAPVDLAQAAIGPGMAVFTRYARVLDAEGNAISVREALARINEVLDEVLAAQEGDFDPDTRWAVTWFDQFGFEEGDYGQAEQLSKAKNTAVAELADVRNGGIVTSRGGKVKLTRPADLPEGWDPDEDPRLTVWEMVHHLIARMDENGEAGAAELVAQLGIRAESARELAYRLYAIAERKKRSADGQAYNALVQSWPELVRLARDITASGATGPAQAELAI